MSLFFWDINFRKFIAKKKKKTITTTKVCVGREQNSKRKLQVSISTSNARQNWLALNYVPDNSATVATSFSSPSYDCLQYPTNKRSSIEPSRKLKLNYEKIFKFYIIITTSGETTLGKIKRDFIHIKGWNHSLAQGLLPPKF